MMEQTTNSQRATEKTTTVATASKPESATRLDKLKQRKAQLEAQIQNLEAAEKARERKRETRRKILVGAYYLEKAKQENRWSEVCQLMDNYLSRPSDRVLFDLPDKRVKTTS